MLKMQYGFEIGHGFGHAELGYTSFRLEPIFIYLKK